MRLQTRNPLLRFENAQDKLIDSLSAALFVGNDLWVASDELTSIERLSTDDGLTFQHHKSFPLDGLIDLSAQGCMIHEYSFILPEYSCKVIAALTDLRLVISRLLDKHAERALPYL
jgi:hypothetical protein